MTISLKIIKLQCVARATRDVSLGDRERLGNTLRGAFGSTLAWLYDDHPDRRYRNIRDLIFKNTTAPDYHNEILRLTAKRGNYPNPFLLECAKLESPNLRKDDTFTFNVTLLGEACNYVKEVAIVTEKMCGGRIGRDISAFTVDSITDYQTGIDLTKATPQRVDTEGLYVWSNAQITPEVKTLTIDFIEETVLSETAERQNIVIEGLSFEEFMYAVLSRIALLCSGFGTGVIKDDQIRELLEQASLIRTTSHALHYESFFNHSRSLPNKKVPVSGFTGTIEYAGNLSVFLPYVRLGSLLHIGGMTTRGLGHYTYSTNNEKLQDPYAVIPLG